MHSSIVIKWEFTSQRTNFAVRITHCTGTVVKFEMNSPIYFVFFIIATFMLINLSEVYCGKTTDPDIVTGRQNGYQPLYIVEKDKAYDFVDSATYDLVMNQHEYAKSGHRMLAACSNDNSKDSFVKVHYFFEDQLADEIPIFCKHPVKFFVTFEYGSAMYLIGFMINSLWKRFPKNDHFYKLPKTQWPLALIDVTHTSSYEIYAKRFSQYEIKYANMLPKNEKSDVYSQNLKKYHNNIDIFGFDVDSAYESEVQLKFIEEFFKSKYNTELVKLQLAPAADFFFDPWKRASRTNINTIPVWKELVPEWYLLERFIRRVASIVGDLYIITGGQKTDANDLPTILYDSTEIEPCLVYNTVIKNVLFKQKRKNGEWYKQGIAFHMVNDPRVKYDDPDEFAEKNGWKYLDQRIVERRIIAKPVTKSKEYFLNFNENCPIFNLNNVKILSRNDKDEEIETEVNVLQKIMEKYTVQYDPLYVVKENNIYKFADSVTYERVMNQHELDKSSVKMMAACNRQNHDENDMLLEIVPVEEKQLASRDGFGCKTPIEFFVKEKANKEDYMIGFMIYDENGNFDNPSTIPDIPENSFPLSLINVEYKKADKYHSSATWHSIKYANLLPVDEETDPLDQRSKLQSTYRKDIDIVGFDIDEAYEQENLSKFNTLLGLQPTSQWVKMQLSPSADFYFDAWKRASRTNLNTTPIWHEFVTEWHEFERFIRRVAKVVGDLEIITGGIDPIYESVSYGDPLYFYKKENSSSYLPVFDIIFKTISFNQQRRNGEWIRQGIIFFMFNDPRSEEKFVNRLAADNGWIYLGDRGKETRITGQKMNTEKLEDLNIISDFTYEEFNLYKVKKLSVNENGEETVIEINVVKELMAQPN